MQNGTPNNPQNTDDTIRASRNTDEGTVDERELQRFLADTHDLGLLSVGDVIDWCERQCVDDAIPFRREWTSRRNDRGEAIGPDVRIGYAAGDIILPIIEAMVKARDEAYATAVAPLLADRRIPDVLEVATPDSTVTVKRSRPSCPEVTWCTNTTDPQEHARFHAGDIVDLAGSDGSGRQGWWAWPVQDRGSEPVIEVEGPTDPAVTVPATLAALVLEATETPAARMALRAMLEEIGQGAES